MAHDFGAENLEDGEQWLPSDFFSIDEVQVSNKITTPPSYCSSAKPSCMEGLQLFSGAPFLQHHPHNRGLYKRLPNLQPAVCYGSMGVPNGGDPCECGIGNSWTGCSSIYRLQYLNPVQYQAEPKVECCFIGGRALAPQKSQRRRFTMNRVFPLVETGGHGGTGVFLPRISSNTHTATVTKNNNHQCVGKGPRMKNPRGFQVPPRKIWHNRRQEECPGNAATTEVGMPNNRNY